MRHIVDVNRNSRSAGSPLGRVTDMSKLETATEILEWARWDGTSPLLTASDEDRATAAELAKGQRLLRAFREADEELDGECYAEFALLARLRAALEEP
jgi:hypothetical protein